MFKNVRKTEVFQNFSEVLLSEWNPIYYQQSCFFSGLVRRLKKELNQYGLLQVIITQSVGRVAFQLIFLSLKDDIYDGKVTALWLQLGSQPNAY